ncbi:hypothetical protein N9H19_00800 [Flavobacteriales bacterium]|nr:hypothetical protein [Flavobacteriales bacterium]
MSIKIIKNILILVLTIICVKGYLDSRNSKEYYSNNLEILTDSIYYYENRLGQEVASVGVYKGEVEDLKKLVKIKSKQLEAALKTFKKPISAISINSELSLDTLFVPINIDAEFNISFNEINKHYNISGESSNKGLSIYSLIIPNEQSIVIGKKRVGFFQYEHKAEVINSNPFIQTVGVSSFDFTPPKKRFGVGLFAGYDFRLQPTIGVGVTYDVFRF